MTTNRKAVLVMDMPENCLECPLRYHDGDTPLGDFKFQRLYRCRLEPEDIEDIYLSDIINKKQDWCPLKEMPEKKTLPEHTACFDVYENGCRDGWNACIDEICNK